METSGVTVEQALDLAKRGMAYEACERLWPLVRDPATRDEAVFTLAYCFERSNNLPTAAYLYGWVADRHPEFNVAARRFANCRAALDARGLHEDFSDAGHVDCACGSFRYRAELGLCPYCGMTAGSSTPLPDSAREEIAGASAGASSAGPSTDPFRNIRRDLERTWKTIQEKFDEFKQRDDLSGPAQHAQVLAKELSERVRKFSESESGQSLKRTAEGVRERTTEQLRAASDREDVQQARTRLEGWTRDAANRIEEFTRSERVQSVGRTTYNALEKFVSRVQAHIDRTLGRTPADSPAADEASPESYRSESGPEDDAPRDR
jgi:hypothetical protein